MKYLTEEEIRNLPTARILSYKKKHFPFRNKMRILNNIFWDCECAESRLFWTRVVDYENAYEMLKKLLSERENVERK